MSRLTFSLMIGAMVLAAGVLAVNATDASPTRQENGLTCLNDYFRVCPNTSQTEPEIRACIKAHKATFSPYCLSLVKEIK